MVRWGSQHHPPKPHQRAHVPHVKGLPGQKVKKTPGQKVTRTSGQKVKMKQGPYVNCIITYVYFIIPHLTNIIDYAHGIRQSHSPMGTINQRDITGPITAGLTTPTGPAANHTVTTPTGCHAYKTYSSVLLLSDVGRK